MTHKPHIEITDEQARTVLSGQKHAYLQSKGWRHVGDNGKEDLYTKIDAFDASDLTLSDAFQLQKIIDSWGKK